MRNLEYINNNINQAIKKNCRDTIASAQAAYEQALALNVIAQELTSIRKILDGLVQTEIERRIERNEIVQALERAEASPELIDTYKCKLNSGYDTPLWTLTLYKLRSDEVMPKGNSYGHEVNRRFYRQLRTAIFKQEDPDGFARFVELADHPLWQWIETLKLDTRTQNTLRRAMDHDLWWMTVAEFKIGIQQGNFSVPDFGDKSRQLVVEAIEKLNGNEQRA